MRNIIPSQLLQHNQITVLTTQQIAEAYGTDYRTVLRNFRNNKDRYTEGKHYFILEGKDVKTFASSHQANKIGGGEFDHSLPLPEQIRDAQTLYLWTEKGAWLLAKSLNTDEAWQACEMIVDTYYRQKEIITLQQERIKKMATLIGKNMTISSLPPNVLSSVNLSEAETAIVRLRQLIRPLREYVEKIPQGKAKTGGLTQEDARNLATLLRSMHENLNTVHVQSEHMQEVLDLGDMQAIKQESIINQIFKTLELPVPPELLALPEPN